MACGGISFLFFYLNLSFYSTNPILCHLQYLKSVRAAALSHSASLPVVQNDRAEIEEFESGDFFCPLFLSLFSFRQFLLSTLPPVGDEV